MRGAAVRFLVVDDSRAMQSIVRRGLLKAGYQNLDIKLAGDGLEALEIIRVWRPDMVLSDWHMPNMNGMELLDAIKRQMLDVRIGFVTTESSPQRLQEARTAGALFIVNKPFSDEELVRAVVGAIETDGTAARPAGTASNADDGAAEDAGAKATPLQLRLPSSDLLAGAINALAQIEVFVEEIEPIKLGDMMMPLVIGLFDGDDGRTRAVIVMDLRAACILGAAVMGESPQSVRTGIAQQSVGSATLKGCEQILKSAAAIVSERSTQRALTLRSVNVVPSIFPKLLALYDRREVERSDYEVAAASYGQGLLTIFAT